MKDSDTRDGDAGAEAGIARESESPPAKTVDADVSGSRELAMLALDLPDQPADLAGYIERVWVILRDNSAGSLAGARASVDAVFATLARRSIAWMASGSLEELEELQRSTQLARDRAAPRPWILSELDVADRLAAQTAVLEAILQVFLAGGTVAAGLARLSGARRSRWREALKQICKGGAVVRASDLIAWKIFENANSADNALRSLVRDGMLARESGSAHAGQAAYSATWHGMRVARALEDQDNGEVDAPPDDSISNDLATIDVPESSLFSRDRLQDARMNEEALLSAAAGLRR